MDMLHFIAPLSIIIEKEKADSQSKNYLQQTEIYFYFLVSKVAL